MTPTWDSDDEDPEYCYGSCERCGCNLTDESEAMDGVCDQCQWWGEQNWWTNDP